MNYSSIFDTLYNFGFIIPSARAKNIKGDNSANDFLGISSNSNILFWTFSLYRITFSFPYCISTIFSDLSPVAFSFNVFIYPVAFSFNIFIYPNLSTIAFSFIIYIDSNEIRDFAPIFIPNEYLCTFCLTNYDANQCPILFTVHRAHSDFRAYFHTITRSLQEREQFAV